MAIISQAALASNSSPVDPTKQSAVDKVIAWENVLNPIPTEHLLKLYQLTEAGNKSHSGMLTPADMVKYWKTDYSRKLRHFVKQEIPTRAESLESLQKFHTGIEYEKQQRIHRTIIGKHPAWQQMYVTGNYIPDGTECTCGLEKNPMYIYRNGNKQMCLWCLKSYLGIKI